MKVIDLDGDITDWKIRGKSISSRYNLAKSQNHLIARQLLKEIFPTSPICEEVSISINKNKVLFLDFYLPVRSIAIEVQGQQHFKYNYLFFNNKAEFLLQQKNDKNKAQWCEINNIQLIILRYDEDINVWRSKFNSETETRKDTRNS